MGGNGDTAFYWNLTKNIFRFSPSNPVSNELIHTVCSLLLYASARYNSNPHASRSLCR